MTTEEWIAIGTGIGAVAMLIPVFIQVGQMLRASGRQEQKIDNLTEGMRAVHTRLDDAKKEFRASDASIHDKIETNHNNLSAQLIELHDALLIEGIIVPAGANGRSKVSR